MKTALIFAVRLQGSHQFGWKWRAVGAPVEAQQIFQYFYDCIQDGVKAGYQCRYEGVRENGKDAPQQHWVPGPAQGALTRQQ